MDFKTPTAIEIETHIKTAQRMRSEYFGSVLRRLFGRSPATSNAAAAAQAG
jgi:hypothetical protein